jgi:protein gp37
MVYYRQIKYTVMGYETKIGWTNTYLTSEVVWNGVTTTTIPGATFNPWWGCEKVSPACKFCYAEYFSDVRMGNKLWGPGSTRKMFGDKHWNEPLKWNRECEKLGIRRKVFCASMADVFEDHPDVIEARERLWRLIEATPYLDWLLLTKRPENILKMLPDRWASPTAHEFVDGTKHMDDVPLNIAFGTTVENQTWAEKRVREICNVKLKTGRVIFLSMEPLLGSVDLDQDYFEHRLIRNVPSDSRTKWLDLINWVIVGGESGKDARPSHPQWFRDILHQCKKYKVPFFSKQWGEYSPQWKKDAAKNIFVYPDGTSSPNQAVKNGVRGQLMSWWGKSGAGAMLDGEEYLEIPTIK